MPDRAILYLRISVVGDRAKRGRLESPELQRDASTGWCQARGIEVVGEVQDLNRSGGTLTRPGLERALDALRAGNADGIVVARSDRASRRTLDGLGLIEQLEQEGYWIAAADGTIDTTDRIRRMATTMHFAMAESELERFREQSAIIHQRAIVDKGRQMGPAPFGMRRGADGRLELDPDRAEWARFVFERRADGQGWVAIARDLDQAGVRQANGRLINQHLLARMVRRRVYLGEAYHGDHVKTAAHPALIDEALWAAANRARPPVRSSPGTQRVHPESLLRGLVRCAGCRYAMKRMPQRLGAAPKWLCRAKLTERAATHECSAPAVVRSAEHDELERLVVAQFMALAAGVASERAAGEDVPALERNHGEAEALLDELSELEVRRSLGQARWARMTADARDALEHAEHELAAARTRARSVGQADRATLEQHWATVGLAERQEFLRGIVQAVMVRSGDGPLAGRVDVLPVWAAVELPRRGAEFAARVWPD